MSDQGLVLVDLLENRCITTSGGIAALRASLSRIAQRNDIQVVVVVCQNKLPSDTYNTLKFFADVRIGIHTSCILVDKFRKNTGQKPLNDSYFSNVALKMNLKLGGINHTLKEPIELTKKDAALMVVGYDVTHPTEDKEDEAEERGSTGGGGKGLDDESEQFAEKKKSLEDKVQKQSQVGLVISADDHLGQ